MNKGTIIITRGTSGAGKSLFANSFNGNLLSVKDDKGSLRIGKCVVCCADDAMMENGQYVFKPEKLGFAHKSCQSKFDKALSDGVGLIVVSNTNTKYKDFSYYLDKGREAGYIVHVIVLEKYHEGQNQHSVPLKTLEQQQQNIKSSLKLL